MIRSPELGRGRAGVRGGISFAFEPGLRIGVARAPAAPAVDVMTQVALAALEHVRIEGETSAAMFWIAGRVDALVATQGQTGRAVLRARVVGGHAHRSRLRSTRKTGEQTVAAKAGLGVAAGSVAGAAVVPVLERIDTLIAASCQVVRALAAPETAELQRRAGLAAIAAMGGALLDVHTAVRSTLPESAVGVSAIANAFPTGTARIALTEIPTLAAVVAADVCVDALVVTALEL